MFEIHWKSLTRQRNPLKRPLNHLKQFLASHERLKMTLKTPEISWIPWRRSWNLESTWKKNLKLWNRPRISLKPIGTSSKTYELALEQISQFSRYLTRVSSGISAGVTPGNSVFQKYSQKCFRSSSWDFSQSCRCSSRSFPGFS